MVQTRCPKESVFRPSMVPQTEFGGSDDPRLIPLFASLIEIRPCIKQWHNEPNANFDGLRMGDYFEGFINEEARNLGKTVAEIKAWVPPAKEQRCRVAEVQRDRVTETNEDYRYLNTL